MKTITSDELYKQVMAYASPTSSTSPFSLRDSEPFLFEANTTDKAEIHDNEDYKMEELTDDDLKCDINLC